MAAASDCKAVDITFCLPVYNVYPYLNDCINSILNQNLDQHNITYEILCIDDCSSDGSYEWLSACSDRIVQLRLEKNEENRGVSYTRNRLAREARGEYIWYIDPDDMLIRNVAAVFYQLAKKCHADVFRGDYIRVPENASESEEHGFSGSVEAVRIRKTKSESPKDASGVTMHAIWAGLFLRSFLIKNNLTMNEKMIAQEDTLFYYECFLKTENVYKCDVPCYLYRQRASSVMHLRNDLRARKYYLSMVEMLRVYQAHLDDQDYDDKAVLDNKIHHSKQNVVQCLASTQDKAYIKQQLKTLRQAKIYPYAFRREALKSKQRLLGFLTFLLPLRPFFWLYHYIYVYTHRASK